MKTNRLSAWRPPVAIMLAVSVVMAVVLAVSPAGAQDYRTGEPGDFVVFIDRDDIPEGSTCTVLFENNFSSHPGNVASARSSLEREVHANFEDGSGETLVLTIESDGVLFAGVRLGETGGTSTNVGFTCAPTPTTTVPTEVTVVPTETTVAPTESTIVPTETTVAPTETTVAPTTTEAVATTTTQVIDTEVQGQVEEQPAPQLAVTGRTQQAALGFALLSVGLGILLMAMSALEPRTQP